MIEAIHHLEELKESLSRLRGDLSKPAQASIVVPINAAKDLANVLNLFADLVQ